MPAWLTEFLDTQVVLFVIGVATIAGAIWKAIAWVRPYLRGTAAFLEDWNGAPERRDPNTGELIEPAKPSAPALLERMRHQVENSHKTNMRDDLDDQTRRINEVADLVVALRADLAEHIGIAKQDGERLAAVEAQLKKEA